MNTLKGFIGTLGQIVAVVFGSGFTRPVDVTWERYPFS